MPSGGQAGSGPRNAGDARIRLLASDGLHQAEAVSAPITAAALPAVPFMRRPVRGSMVPENKAVIVPDSATIINLP